MCPAIGRLPSSFDMIIKLAAFFKPPTVPIVLYNSQLYKFKKVHFSNFPELLIKNADTFFISVKSDSYHDFTENLEKVFSRKNYYIYRHFLPFGRVNLTASASL
jgi:hypothetical protein